MKTDFTEEQKAQLAKWAGEAAKSWWSETDESRRKVESLEPYQIFIVAWQAARLAKNPFKPVDKPESL